VLPANLFLTIRRAAILVRARRISDFYSGVHWKKMPLLRPQLDILKFHEPLRRVLVIAHGDEAE
jgi:hypothetical protein